jgi:hypothetical protein
VFDNYSYTPHEIALLYRLFFVFRFAYLFPSVFLHILIHDRDQHFRPAPSARFGMSLVDPAPTAQHPHSRSASASEIIADAPDHRGNECHNRPGVAVPGIHDRPPPRPVRGGDEGRQQQERDNAWKPHLSPMRYAN